MVRAMPTSSRSRRVGAALLRRCELPRRSPITGAIIAAWTQTGQIRSSTRRRVNRAFGRGNAGLGLSLQGCLRLAAGCADRNEKGAAQKQMGPALLPTPLSPARGRYGPASLRANPLSCSSSSALGARCLSPSRLVLPVLPCGSSFRHGRASGFVTGARTGIRPCFVTALSGLSRSSHPCGVSPLAKPRPRSYRLAVLRCSSGQSPFLQPLPTSTVVFPMTLLALPSNKASCIVPKHSAFRLSVSAWTVATASLVLEKL